MTTCNVCGHEATACTHADCPQASPDEGVERMRKNPTDWSARVIKDPEPSFRRMGVEQADGTVLHTEESVAYALRVGAELCEAQGRADPAQILRDLFERKATWPTAQK